MTYKVRGYIIRKQDAREYDKMFTLYTREQGKIRAMAHGVKKISSKLSGNLELLHEASYTIASGKQMDRITTVDVAATYEPIKNDMKKLICALYCFDVIDHLIKDSQQDSQIYGLIGEMLDALAISSSMHAPLIADAFLLKFRMVCGYGMPKRAQETISLFSEKNLSEIPAHIRAEDTKKIHTLARAFIFEYAEKELKTRVFFDFFAHAAV
ncbi:DNA repair protein RecO [Candidatus Uhrbacteria bacterium]|nr:DNA repair protein RecO [Candidatus Uhrbacteria bacterium]